MERLHVQQHSMQFKQYRGKKGSFIFTDQWQHSEQVG